MARVPNRREGPIRATLSGTQKRIRGFGLVGEVYSELKRVTWPPREEVTRLTMMVIGISSVIGIILGGIDAAFSQGFNVFLFR